MLTKNLCLQMRLNPRTNLKVLIAAFFGAIFLSRIFNGSLTSSQSPVPTTPPVPYDPVPWMGAIVLNPPLMRESDEGLDEQPVDKYHRLFPMT